MVELTLSVENGNSFLSDVRPKFLVGAVLGGRCCNAKWMVYSMICKLQFWYQSVNQLDLVPAEMFDGFLHRDVVI